jgi:chromate transport protein ChrA
VKARSNILRFILRSLGLILCVAPPIVCTLTYFPLWREAGGEALISGGTALLIIIAIIPFYKHLRKLLETSASYVLWLVIFLFCFLMAKVINEITVIAFIGLVGNLLGALLLKLGERKET